MPIMDYHNHLPADQIAKDLQFENITRLLLNGDHYKWRAMQANGVDGHFSQADIENGELPNDIPWIGKVVRDICYYNTKTI
jgi:glucuronate isomerase